MCGLRVVGFAVVGLVALIWVALPGAASADSPEAVVEQPTESRTIVLQPGWNYIGWVGDPASPAALFSAVPEIEVVYAWDAFARRWLIAAPAIPTQVHTLHILEPGMGLQIRLSGDSPVEWRRDVSPTRGLVALEDEYNLVAWSGPSDSSITKVVQGIGKSLIRAHRWNHETGAFDTYDPTDSQSAQSFPLVNRGDALWIEMERNVNWLQPTGLMPRIVFAGGAGQDQEARIVEDVRSVIEFFADHYGIQADASSLTINFWTDFDYLVASGPYSEIDREFYESIVASAGSDGYGGGYFGPTYITVRPGVGRYTITHEYTHIIQHQLRTAAWDALYPRNAAWLTEGTAEYAAARHASLDGASNPYNLAPLAARAARPDSPTLQATERNNAGWHYTLGELATTWLVEDYGTDAWIELLRQYLPRRIGPERTWQSALPWQESFEGTLGESVSDFYERFEARRSEVASADSDQGAGRYSITGTVRDTNGAPLEGWRTETYRLDHGGWRLAIDITDVHGRYELNGFGACECIVSLLNAAGQRVLFFSDGGSVRSRDRASQLHIAQQDMHGIDFVVPEDLQAPSFEVTIVGPDDKPLAGIEGLLSAPESNLSVRTSRKGTLRIAKGTLGPIRLSVELAPGCKLYVGQEGLVTDYSRALAFEPGVESIADLRIQVRADQCVHRINGRVTKPTTLTWLGRGVFERVRVEAGSQAGYASVWSRTSGDYTVTLPQSGQYWIRVRIGECDVYYGPDSPDSPDSPDGPVADRDAAALIGSADNGRAGVNISVPEGMCTSATISGMLLDAEGNGMAHARLEARRVEGWGSAFGRTDTDGSFSISVGNVGDYMLMHDVDGCSVIYGEQGPTSLRHKAAQIRVADADVTGIVFRLPEDPDLFCVEDRGEAPIVGRFIDAGGKGIAHALISADDGKGNGTAEFTEIDGSFALYPPVPGQYLLSNYEDGCIVYYRSGGATGNRDQATAVRSADGAQASVTFQLSSDSCKLQIRGRLLNADGTAAQGLSVNAQGDGSWATSGDTGVDGSFKITVPTSGRYWLYTWWTDECPIFYSRSGPTSEPSEDTFLLVSDADVTGIVFRLPKDPASFCD